MHWFYWYSSLLRSDSSSQSSPTIPSFPSVLSLPSPSTSRTQTATSSCTPPPIVSTGPSWSPPTRTVSSSSQSLTSSASYRYPLWASYLLFADSCIASSHSPSSPRTTGVSFSASLLLVSWFSLPSWSSSQSISASDQPLQSGRSPSRHSRSSSSCSGEACHGYCAETCPWCSDWGQGWGGKRCDGTLNSD